MKDLFSVLFISFLLSTSYGQHLDAPTFINLYNNSFKDHFSDFIEEGSSNQFYILSDTNLFPSEIEYENFEIHFLTKGQEYELIKTNQIKNLYWVKIDTINKDTIDLNIGGWSVEYKKSFLKKGHFYYAIWCGGTMGYIPEGRLVYNYNLRIWTYISRDEIIDEKLQAEKKRKLKD